MIINSGTAGSDSGSGAALNVEARSGWLTGVRRVLSPNCDSRPEGVKPDLIVVHGISLPPGEFGGPWVDRLFTNALPASVHPYFATIADLRVSAHVLVQRDGTPVQYVPFHMRAWHSGASSHRGRDACNDFAVGIEMEGTDDTPYEPAQYRTLAALIRSLELAYPSLHGCDVVGHCDVSPGRKSDPGPAFDWPLLRQLLGRELTNS
jgi:N-acetyl-anhydromuramoyl-L-alanine amidase